jgi:hypothetical protein
MEVVKAVKIIATDYYEEQAILARYPNVIFIPSVVKGKTVFFLPEEKYEEILQFKEYFEGRIKSAKER